MVLGTEAVQRAVPMAVAAGATAGVTLRVDEHGCAWVVLTEPATYSVALVEHQPGAGATILPFEPRDLSAPAAWADPVDEPLDLPMAVGAWGGEVVEAHRVAARSAPLYLRATADRVGAGQLTVVAHRHA